MPTLVFATPSGKTHNLKSVSRMNTIGHDTATTIAHATSGHARRRGSDHCKAPRSDRVSASSGRIQTISRLKCS